MSARKTIVVGLIGLLLVPAALSGRPESNRTLTRRIARLEARIQELETRIALLEEMIAELSRRAGTAPLREEEPGDNWKKLMQGMTRAEVKLILGEPDEIAPLSLYEIWDYSRSYGRPCTVTFDEEGRVLSWSAP
jgi:uncharacterized coiled-coil protein SlyX